MSKKRCLLAKRNTSPTFEWSGRWELLWCWPGFGLVLLLDLDVICLFDPKKNICFAFLKGRGCVESKNKTNAKSYELIRSINNPSWFIQMQGWCSSWCSVKSTFLDQRLYRAMFSEINIWSLSLILTLLMFSEINKMLILLNIDFTELYSTHLTNGQWPCN